MNARRLKRRSGTAAAGRIAKKDERPALLDDQKLEEHLPRPIESLGQEEKLYIRVTDSGALSTNLGRGLLITYFRLAKLELEELREDLQPHKVKVIGGLIDLMEVPQDKKKAR
ncbi:MAG: hypothetical protein U0R44_04105 [Candidatus Micrarchaeia archaeon]